MLNGAGILQIAVRIRLTTGSRGRRRAPEEEEVQPRDTVSDIQTAIPVEIHGILATRCGTTKEQPVQQALRIGDVHSPIRIAIVGNGILIDTEESHLVGCLGGQNAEVLVGDHIVHRLASAAAAVDVPDHLGLSHVHLGKRTLDIDPGNGRRTRRRQRHELCKGKNNGAHGTFVTFALGQLGLFETAAAKSTLVFVGRRGPIDRDTDDIEAGISRQADRPALGSDLCSVLSGRQGAINCLVEGQAIDAFDRLAVLARESEFELGQASVTFFRTGVKGAPTQC